MIKGFLCIMLWMNLEGYSKETIASWDSYTPITLSCASL